MPRWTLLLLAVLAVGCTSAPASAPAPEGRDVVMDPEGCQIARVAHLVAPDRLAPLLPAGFRPGDARVYLGEPFAQEGDALVILGVATCPTAAHDETGLHVAELALFVEPPRVPGEREAAVEDFYLPELRVPPGRLADLARGAGWAVVEVELDAALSAPPAGARGSAAWTAPSETVSMEVVGAIDVHHEGLERYWHEGSEGIGYIEAVTSIDQRAGAAHCTLTGAPADVVGASTCAPGRAFGLAVLGGTWTYRFVTLPGVRAEG